MQIFHVQNVTGQFDMNTISIKIALPNAIFPYQIPRDILQRAPVPVQTATIGMRPGAGMQLQFNATASKTSRIGARGAYNRYV